MAAEKVLRNFALFVDGRGLAGNCEEIAPPKLTLIKEDFKAGGLNSAIKITMGQEPMEMNFTLTKFDPKVLALFGMAPGNSVPFVARGALQSLSGSVEPVEIYCRGEMGEIDPGSWQPQTKVAQKFKVDLTYYRYTQAGTVIHEIDVPNMKMIINGVDQMSAIRDAIGI